MTEFPRRYGSLTDWLYRFVANVAQWDAADWHKREQIEMALRLIKRLKKKADVVKLVTDGNGKDAS